METKANHVIIGAFTVAILVLAFLFVLWIGKLRVAREWDYYEIVFNESVTGLTVGGAVQYNGIQVGEVRKLLLAPENPSQVIAQIRVGGGTPVKADTKAKLTFTGLTGVSLIQLTGGSQDAPMLTAEEGDGMPRIVADESALQKLLASSEDIVGVVNDMLRQLSRLLNQENLDKIAATIDHVEKVTASLSKHDGDIEQMITSLKVTLQRSEQVMLRLDTLAKSSNDVLNNDAKESLAAARASLESVKQFTDNASAMIEQNRGAVAQFSNQGLSQVGPAVTELRAAVRNLRDLSDQLKDDPQSLLKGKKEQVKEHQDQ